MKAKIMMPLLLCNLFLTILSAVAIYLSADKLLWLGAMIAAASGPLYILVVGNVLKPARTSANLPLMQLIGFVGLLISIYALISTDARTINTLAALLVCASGVLYVQWYIRVFSIYNRKKSQTITKGQPLPDFPLERLDGTLISSTSFSGKNTLIIFFRGNWCALCMGQIKEIVNRADRLLEMDVKALFISNQSIEKSQQLTAELELPDHIEVMFDRDLRAAKSLEIEDVDGAPLGIVGYPRDTVMATVIALDDQGRVIFGDETDNYRVRPHPDTFLPVFSNP